MNIAVTTPKYIDSVACCIIDGLLALGHRVYNLNGPAINYAESWPIPSPDKIDIWMMMDTDNQLGLVLPPDKMGTSLLGAAKVVVHGHDHWTDYVNVPNSPVKPVPVDKSVGDVLFVRDLDVSTKEQCDRRGLPAYAIDYAIERRYVEACADHLKTKRKMELLFLGTLDTARRRFYLDVVRGAGLPVRYGTYEFNEPDSKWSKHIYGRYTHDPRYYQELCKYLFAFVPFGAGCSTMRLPEAYAAGCIPVIQQYPEEIISYHTFVDGVNCILWNTEKELIDKLRYWMDKPEEAERLRKRCYEHGQNYMTSKILAQYILERITNDN
jgi:hypothetical protein